MAGAVSPVVFRHDPPRDQQVCNLLASLRGNAEDEFWFAIRRMEQDAVQTAEAVEVLDGRYRTYAIDLGGGGFVLLADYDIVDRQWTLLDLVANNPSGPDGDQVSRLGVDVLVNHQIEHRLYRECCAARGLNSPRRDPV